MHVLESVFDKGPAEAYRIMMEVHTRGRGVCGAYTYEVAETKVATVHDWPARRAFPLQGGHRGGLKVFNASLERVLNVAAREAMVRRHADLTVEHLLFAAAHDPEGEEILEAAGADVPRLRKELADFLEQTMQKLPPGSRRPPQQTLAFRRVLQTAVVHVQSAGKDEAGVGDMLAALMREARSHAVELLTAQGVTRLDVLNFISHGVRKAPARDRDGETAGGGDGRPGGETRRTSRAARATRWPPTRRTSRERAREGKLDPVIGRVREMNRALEVLCRRRKNNPVFVGEPGVGKTAIVEGLAQKLIEDGSPEALRGRRDLLARHGRAARGHALPGRLRGALQGGDPGAAQAAAADPVHRRDAHDGRGRRHDRRHDGPRQPDQADPHRGRDPADGLDDLRGVQARRARPRARAPRAAHRRRRAERGRHGAHPAGPARPLRGAPQGQLHGRLARGGGAASRPAPPARRCGCPTARST